MPPGLTFSRCCREAGNVMGVICCAPPELLDNSEQLTCLHTTACAVFARNEEGLPGIVASKHCLAACIPGLPNTVKHSMLQRAIKDPSRTEVQAEVSWATTDVAYAGRICVCIICYSCHTDCRYSRLQLAKTLSLQIISAISTA